MQATRKGKIVGLLLVAGLAGLVLAWIASGLWAGGGAGEGPARERAEATAPTGPVSPGDGEGEVEEPVPSEETAAEPEPDVPVVEVANRVRQSFTNDWHAGRPGFPAHEGTDLAGRLGAPVRAMVGGKVVPVSGGGPEGSAGGEILVEAAEEVGPVKKGDHVYYSNLKGPSPLKPGASVEAGQIVGEMGPQKPGEGEPGNGVDRTGYVHVGWYDAKGKRAEAPSGALNPYPLLLWLAKKGEGAGGPEGLGAAFPLKAEDAAAEPPPALFGEGPGVKAPDPLGLAEERVDSGVANGARLAANSFVMFCYGYSGDDEEEYMRGVNAIVLDPEFHKTPGGQAIRRTRESLAEEGESAKASARLDDFGVVKVGEGEAGGVVAEIRFSVGEGREGTELSGDVRAYAQKISMIPWGTGAQAWKVSHATEPRNVGEGGA